MTHCIDRNNNITLGMMMIIECNGCVERAPHGLYDMNYTKCNLIMCALSLKVKWVRFT